MSGPSAVPPGLTRPRLHWGWTLGLTGLLLAGAAAVVLHSPWLKLRQIEVAGAERADVAGRLAQGGIGPGAFMIWLRPGEIEDAVEQDPWVREVRVERVFPDRLVVEVLEHTPAVWAGHGDSWMLLSRGAVVIAVADRPGDGFLRARLPWEAWDVGEEAGGQEWLELADLGLGLSPGLAAESWVSSEGGELWLEARGFRARLGAAVDLADKGRAFEALLAAGLPEGAVVDLVAPTRPSVGVPGGEDEPVVEGEDEG